MRCELVERELSARLDGEIDVGSDSSIAEHIETCSRCRAFEAQIHRIHELARVQPAGPVPDLVPAIMAQVRRERAPRRGAIITLPRPSPVWGRHAAAFVAGAVAAALLLGGLPMLRRGPSSALASDIPGRVAQASREVA
ncbi:MAG TPA: zf-HC2 domain-containing protein, partial [Actinomycetota bacterium]|nr:zf-HC2 domain-containing protein [Actinomycetota bacterium]